MQKGSAFEAQGYNMTVVGKHFTITEAIRAYALEKLAKVEKITDQIIDVIVTLDAQKMEHSCSILMNFIHFHIKVSAATDNMYASIDKASDRVIKLVRKYKTKLQSHRFKDRSTVDIHVNVIGPLRDDLKAINDDIEAETVRREEGRYKLHEVVAKEVMPLKILTQEEAIMKMEITEEPLLLYRSEEDRKLKVLYRRVDGNYNLVMVE